MLWRQIKIKIIKLIFLQTIVSKLERNIKQQEWDIRGIVPIFYLVSQHNHHYLHQTLKEWGNHYEKNRITVRQKIIDQYIDLNPDTNTKENDFIGRLLWALSDNTRITARHFACRVPLPNFHWLSAFLRYEQDPRFQQLQLYC